VPYAESVGALVELKNEGKIRHIGVSNVNEAQLGEAEALTPIVSVQNRYNLVDRSSEAIVDRCEIEDMAFLPWAPVQDADRQRAVQEIAEAHDATVPQIVLAWLLARSPAMLPIPGTGSVAHLEENVAAAGIRLSPDEVRTLTAG
jgi:aryl-alcohol dehydrogenase-like predicted oxidoreductase